jgi:hypothetical protein
MKTSLNFGLPVVAATELRRPGSNERLIGSNGELNANSVPELLKAIASLAEATRDGSVGTEKEVASAQSHKEMVLAAFDDPEELSALGDMLAESLTITSNRDGFMRRLLREQDVVQGARPEARLNTKNVSASIATGPVQTQTQIVRDNDIFPPEFYITARPFIEERDIARSSSDLLEEKYVDALEAIMVQEDRTWKQAADNVVGLDNPHLNIAGSFTPSSFAAMVNSVSRWGITPAAALLASDLWTDITSNSDWHTIIDPVAQHELLMTGKLGVVHGVSLITDQYRHQQHKVLNGGDIYVVGAPDQHGQYTDRGGVQSKPIDETQERIPGRGWAMSELVSIAIINSRSVARGRRV